MERGRELDSLPICPCCKQEMVETFGGSAGNLKNKEWLELHWECKTCGIKKRYIMTKALE